MRRKSFCQYLWHSLPWVAALSAAVLLAQILGWLHPAEVALVDALNLFRAPELEERIVTVTIDRRDFEHDFGGKYPLDPEPVKSLLRAIASGRPLTIGVDLETENWKASDLAGLPREVPIVWARAGTVESNGKIEPSSVLGGTVDMQSADSGLAVFPFDRDGLIRRYERTFLLDGTVVASFPWAIYATVRKLEAHATLHPQDNQVIFPLGVSRIPNIPAGAVMEASELAGTAWADRGLLRDRIVLVGGSYAPANDVHATPQGPQAGVQIVAQALSAELNGAGIVPVAGWLTFSMEVLIGISLTIVQYYTRGPRAILLGLGLAVALSVAASLALFRTSALWINFVPVWAAVVLHNIWEAFLENRALRAEVQEFRTAAAAPREGAEASSSSGVPQRPELGAVPVEAKHEELGLNP